MKKVTLIILLFCVSVINAQSQLAEDNYDIKNISANSKYQDFGVSFFGEKGVVFASSRKKKTIKNNTWRGNNQPFLQLYKGVRSENGEISGIEELSKDINTKFHDADLTYTKDLKTVYFTSNNYLNKKFKKDTLGWNLNQLYRADRDANGEWKNIVAMPFNNDNYQTGHPVLNVDETQLYFISDMPGGYGLTDIYVVDILPDGKYGDPLNLGPNVNTEGKEMFPYIGDLNYLYFASDGYADGMGGLDVYVTRMFGYDPKPSVNLGEPINSIADDFAFAFKNGTNIGYFASNRSGGKGDDDIYSFVEKTPILLYCTQFISGIVTDAITGDPVEGATVIVYDNFGNEADRMVVGYEAEYNFEVACNQGYTVVATKQNYSTDSKEFFLEYGRDAVIPLEIRIEEFLVERGKCLIKINPIYFDFDRSKIRPDAEIELNKVVQIMKKYPELVIEGGSHTDSRGNNRYNELLSARRAKSTVKYIISKGIDPSRIFSKGYGENELANECADGVKCSEEAHQFNRRTEFSIVNYGEIRQIYASICNIETVTGKEQIESEKEIEELAKENIQAFIDNEVDTKLGKVLIKIDPLYFDLNSVEIDESGAQELDKVVNMMNKYPEIIVEGGSHTDSRSSFNDNERLSIRRAESVVNYIISKGIDPRRITAQGYGETQLVNHCANGVRCSEQEHAENRRIEFVIVNPEVITGEKPVDKEEK